MTTQNVKKTNNKNEKKRRFKFPKLPSALTIIIGVVVFAAILTWIPHGSTPDGTTIDGSLASWNEWILNNAIKSGGTFVFTIGSGTANATVYSFEILADSFQNYEELIDRGGFILTVISGPGSLANISGLRATNEIINIFGLDALINEDQILVTHIDLPWTLKMFEDGTFSQFGLLDTARALIGGYWAAFDVALYLIGIFAIVELLTRTGTLKAGVGSLVKGLNNKEIILLPILFLLFSLGGTLFGMQEETLGLLPIIVPVIILAGFDAPSGMMVAALGTTTGIASSVLDPFSVGVMADGLGYGIGVGIFQRLILFVIYTSFGMMFITWYGLRVQKNKNKSIDKSEISNNQIWAKKEIGDITNLESMTGKQTTALVIFGFVFGWMIFSLMPWITWFPELAFNEGWNIFSHIFYGDILLGNWYFIELAILFFLAAILIGAIFKIESKEMINVFWTSLREMFGVITIISFSRATSMILTLSGLTYGMIYGMINIEQLNSISPLSFMLIWAPIFLVMAIFIPSTSGLAGITAPIIGGVVSASGPTNDPHTLLLASGILMIYPLAQGVINMFSPSTGIIVVQAEQSKVNFGKIMPLLIIYAVMILGIGIISSSLIMVVNTILI
ncbi:MAG: hypothetical protein HRS50_00010 [Mycoplasmataceae bacterium]|nr:hypothetical protein [Mycoplasmataceae bacterium]